MPKALSAIVNSHPFATRRPAPPPQAESPPPAAGADSCYGVRSIQSSASWSSDGSDSTALAPRPALPHSSRPAASPTDRASSPAAGARDLESVRDVRDDESDDMSSDPGDERESTPDASRGQPRRSSTTPTAEPAPTAQAHVEAHVVHAGAVLGRPCSLSGERHALLDMLQDAPSASEPSSPASLASLPSCTASLSSLSRLSSPADWGHERAPGSYASSATDERERGEQDLVLPTLALPDTSLHLGLERWGGEGAGVRVALLAPPEHTRAVLAALAARRACVQLPHGEVGVLRGRELEGTVLTGLGAQAVGSRARAAYGALHALLRPQPDATSRQLAAIVAAHSLQADWVHAALVLDDEGADALDALAPLPVLRDDAERADETPRWRAGGLEPWAFSPESLSPTSSSEEEDEEGDEPTPPGTPDGVARAAAQLEAALGDRRVRADSVAAFLAWSPESPEASTLVAEPQPTLAHAGAGGEWEATLSRRLAARRELDLAAARRRSLSTSARGQGGRRLRRRKSSSPPPCGPAGPLFPRRVSGPAPLATGLVGLFESVFAPVKRAWRSPWAVVACALAVAVGCGIWAVRA